MEMIVHPLLQVDVGANDRLEGVVAHFVAHNKAVVALEFDANGSLLLTCDKIKTPYRQYQQWKRMKSQQY